MSPGPSNAVTSLAVGSAGVSARRPDSQLPPAHVLHELAALADRRAQQDRPWALLSDAAKEAGVAMICNGQRPALGWWRHHLRRLPEFDDLPAQLPPAIWTRPWQPWELVVAAIDLSTELVERGLAVDILAGLAADHQLDAPHLLDALTALADTPREP